MVTVVTIKFQFRQMAYQYKRIKLSDGTTRDEHRIVMEKHIDRRLMANECVHHKDGNKRNNDISNLEILERSAHARHHFPSGPRYIMSQAARKRLRDKYSKLTKEQVADVRESNLRSKDLAIKFGVSKFVISRIRTGKSWRIV